MSVRSPSRLAAALVLSLATVARAADPVPPPPPASIAKHVALVEFAKGLERPVAIAFPPGDPESRLFVVEQRGRIRVLHADGRVDDQPILDIAARLSRGNEQGLLGLAFHPKFTENRRLFIYYNDRAGDIHLAELRLPAGAARVDPASERELLTIKHSTYSNHNGGELLFGPDGKLYLGPGDGGFHGDPNYNGQNPKTLLAKLLRLDVDAEHPAPEVVAIGLRNPWRFSFDRKTGDLYIADVGQDKWEEVDVVPAGTLGGQNFGWNLVEGLHCFRGSFCSKPGLVAPVLEYSHKTGCSITGGYVYRGPAIPELDGLYFYTDFCTAIVRSFRFRGGHVEDSWEWRPALDPSFKLAQLSTFAEDASGELYLVSLEGTIYKFVRR
ncbi:MAG TPA: PQQ-dependent sugar dehydrogenase [Polyangia bacterium]|nr:PQQ-dependent sugar dehydrogenase [Polyangia bacterium]